MQRIGPYLQKTWPVLETTIGDPKPLGPKYWVLRVGNLFLKAGQRRSFTYFLGEARRFESGAEALEFAYGDRARRGDTEAQAVWADGMGLATGKGQTAYMTRFLGHEITSVVENGKLWKKYVKVLDLVG